MLPTYCFLLHILVNATSPHIEASYQTPSSHLLFQKLAINLFEVEVIGNIRYDLWNKSIAIEPCRTPLSLELNIPLESGVFILGRLRGYDV